MGELRKAAAVTRAIQNLSFRVQSGEQACQGGIAQRVQLVGKVGSGVKTGTPVAEFAYKKRIAEFEGMDHRAKTR